MADVEIVQLRAATLQLPEWHPEGVGVVDVHAYLIRDGEELILVDSGVGSDHPFIDASYRPVHYPLTDSLKGAGVAPDDISMIVNSHLHFDHCGNNRLFPGVPVVVQAVELDAAREPRYTVPDWVEFDGVMLRPIDGGVKLSSHTRVIPSPGHTPGHQSVLVESNLGAELIVAQAAYTAHEYARATVGEFDLPDGNWSDDAYRDSLAELAALGARRAYFSHDAVVYQAD